MSVTRVPLQPIAKGSIPKLWFAVIVGLVLAGLLAWLGARSLSETPESFLASNADEDGVTALPSGVQYRYIVEGSGPSPEAGDIALVNYKGTLLDGTEFDAADRVPFPVQPGESGIIPGFTEGLMKGKCGSTVRVWIPPEMGYGSEDKINPQTGAVQIPGDSVLVFDIDIVNFVAQSVLQQAQEDQPATPPDGDCGPLAG